MINTMPRAPGPGPGAYFPKVGTFEAGESKSATVIGTGRRFITHGKLYKILSLICVDPQGPGPGKYYEPGEFDSGVSAGGHKLGRGDKIPADSGQCREAVFRC